MSGAELEAGTDREDSSRSGHHRRWLWVLLVAVVVVVGLAGWLLWNVADQVLTPVDTLPMRTRVVAVTEDSVTLPRSGANERDGTYGLEWEDSETGEVGRAVLGEAVGGDDSTVTRELVAGRIPVLGAAARVIVTVWSGDPGELGLHFEEVTFATDVGLMPAWLVPADGSTWVIQVHGLGAGRGAGLRTMPVLHELGYPVLAISYRNDPGAPTDEKGIRQLGASEWRDVDAAVRYAIEHGAHDVVLYGFSMGGAIVEAYLDRADDTGSVRGVVLDSPALDYRAALDHLVAAAGMPGFVGSIEEAIVRWRTGVDLDSVNAIEANRRRGGPARPVLVFHGTADTIIPLSSSQQFADDWPGTVALVVAQGAAHTGSWNVDPDDYERRLAEFLASLDTAGS